MPVRPFDWPPKRFSLSKSAATIRESTVYDDTSTPSLTLLSLVHFPNSDFRSSIFASLSNTFETDHDCGRDSAVDLPVMSSMPNSTATLENKDQTGTTRQTTYAGGPTSASKPARNLVSNVVSLQGSGLQYTSSSSTGRSNLSGSTARPSSPSSRSSADVSHEFPSCSNTGSVAKTAVRQRGIEIVKDGRREQGPKKSSASRKMTKSYVVPPVVAYKNKPLPPEPEIAPLDFFPTDLNHCLSGSLLTESPSQSNKSIAEPVNSDRRSTAVAQHSDREMIKARKSSPKSVTKVKSEDQHDQRDQHHDTSPISLPLFGYGKGISSCDVVERVTFRVMLNLTSVKDLQSVALLNRTFYRTFRKYERSLVNRILFRACPPAWELRQVMKCEQKRSAFRLKSVQRDAATVRAVQSFILMKCQSFCRASTIDGLLGNNLRRRIEIENTIWRIWTFCKLFGKRRAHASNIRSQTTWLEGGDKRNLEGSKSVALGIGNGSGLTVSELEDMSEMWRCLEALLAGFQGREAEARAAGVFDQCSIDEQSAATEKAFLQAWVYDILSLGPKAVLTLISCSFDQAKVLGLTRWSPPVLQQGQLHFLKSAVEHVYRERLVMEAQQQARDYEKMARALSVTPGRPVPRDYRSPSRSNSNPPRLSVMTGQLDPARATVHRRSRSLEDDVIRPDCDPLSSTHRSISPSSSLGNPAEVLSLAITNRASLQVGATLFPVQKLASSPADLHEMSVYPLDDRLSTILENSELPEVIDPVDRALKFLIQDCGYPEVDVKRALTMSDDGRGIDVEKALEYLTAGSGPPLQPTVNEKSESKDDDGHKARTPIQFSKSRRGRRKDDTSIESRLATSNGAVPRVRRRSRLSVASIRRSFSLSIIPDTEEEDQGEEEKRQGNVSGDTSSHSVSQLVQSESDNDSGALRRECSRLYHEALISSTQPRPPRTRFGLSNSADKSARRSGSILRSSLSQTHKLSRSVSTVSSGGNDTSRSIASTISSPVGGSTIGRITREASFEKLSFSPVSPISPIVSGPTVISALRTVSRRLETIAEPPTPAQVQSVQSESSAEASTTPASKSPGGLMTFFLSSGEELDKGKVIIKRKPLRRASDAGSASSGSSNRGASKGVRWKDRESPLSIGCAY